MSRRIKKPIVVVLVLLVAALIIAGLTWIFTCIGKNCVNGTCVFGKCMCKSGWTGTTCSEHPSPVPPVPPTPSKKCPRGCLKGYCTESGVCKCNRGWMGTRCDQVDKRYS